MTARRIDPDDATPQYRQLAAILREMIDVGELASGAELPSKADLAQTYGVSIAGTVDPALNLLVAEGLIIMKRGHRTRVRVRKQWGPNLYAAGRDNYNPNQASNFAREYGVPWNELHLSRAYETVPAPGRIAQALGIELGAPVVRRRWIHEVDGVILRVSWSYLDKKRFGDTVLCDPAEEPWPGGTIAMLVHLGHRPIVEPPSKVCARPGSDEENALLGQEPGDMVLEELRVHTEPGPIFGTWVPLEAALRVYPWRTTTLAYNSTERRQYPAWQG